MRGYVVKNFQRSRNPPSLSAYKASVFGPLGLAADTPPQFIFLQFTPCSSTWL